MTSTTRLGRRTHPEHIFLRVMTTGILCDEDISLLVCGEEVMPVNPHTTSYINWHIADTGNYGQSVVVPS